MERWTGRVALVTGASVGIGAALCDQLARHGMKVVGCARNIEKIEILAGQLKETSKGALVAYKCDISKEDEVRTMFAWIESNIGGVDVCINNAGLSISETLLEGKVESWRYMMDVNVIGLCVCTQEAVKSMRNRGIDDGHVIHINSLSGHRVPPGASSTRFYSATKHAVSALTEGLRQELVELGSHIRVSSISPGLTETEFAHRMYKDEPGRAESTYKSIRCLDAKDVAEAAIYALSTPAHVQIHDIYMRPVEQKY